MTKATAPKKRIGRPTKKPKPGERVPLGLRITPRMKRKLEEAARRKGRSLSQEVELRLERSIDFARHVVIARGDIWSPVLIANGQLLIWIGDELSEAYGEGHQEHVVPLKVSEPDLVRLWNYFNGAPWPYTKSIREIEAAERHAEDEDLDEEGD